MSQSIADFMEKASGMLVGVRKGVYEYSLFPGMEALAITGAVEVESAVSWRLTPNILLQEVQISQFKAEHPGHGDGSKALSVLCRIADACKVKLSLIADNNAVQSPKPTLAQLKLFYVSHGFQAEARLNNPNRMVRMPAQEVRSAVSPKRQNVSQRADSKSAAVLMELEKYRTEGDLGQQDAYIDCGVRFSLYKNSEDAVELVIGRGHPPYQLHVACDVFKAARKYQAGVLMRCSEAHPHNMGIAALLQESHGCAGVPGLDHILCWPHEWKAHDTETFEPSDKDPIDVFYEEFTARYAEMAKLTKLQRPSLKRIGLKPLKQVGPKALPTLKLPDLRKTRKSRSKKS